MKKFLGKLCLSVAALSLIFIVSNCGDDASSPSGSAAPVNDLGAVNQYLQTLPNWESFSNKADTATVQSGNLMADMSENLLCTSVPYSITQNPEEIVTFGSAPNVLYLGSLIQGNSYLGGLGSMVEVPIRQRSPLVVAVNLFSGTPITDTVVNPDGASVQASLNSLVSDASANGLVSGNRIFYNQKETYSLQQGTLKLGMSFKYLGSSGQSQLAYSATSEQKTLTAYFKQVMYEAYIVPPQTPAEFFSTDFTQGKLDEQVALGNIGDNNLPVYVGKIQYGRMMMFTMTSTSSIDSMKLAIEGSYSGFSSYSADVEASLRNVLQTSEFTIVTIGGTSSTALNLLKSGSLSDYFATDDPLTTGVPLGYTLYNLADGSIASVSETTEYEVTECSAVNAQVYLNESEWNNAINDLIPNGVETYEFLTYPGGLTFFTEVTTAPNPAVQTGLSATLSFDRTLYPQYAWPLSFYIQCAGNFVYGDRDANGNLVFGSFAEPEYILSVGNVDQYENDNVLIDVTSWDPNTAVFAIGIDVGGNEDPGGESITVTGINGFTKNYPVTPSGGGTVGSFIGVVSTIPLRTVFFDEDARDDDVFIRNPQFRVIRWVNK